VRESVCISDYWQKPEKQIVENGRIQEWKVNGSKALLLTSYQGKFFAMGFCLQHAKY
jgi:hypothetical protein